MRIIKSETQALIIDIQEKLLPHMNGGDALLANTLKLVEGLNVLGVNLLITQQYTKGLGSTVAPVCDVIGNFEFIEKSAFSCCDEQEFTHALKGIGKHFVIVAGIEAHVCVLQTVLDLMESGYQPVVVEDCISSRNENDKIVALKRMAQHGAIISTMESILFELTRSSKSEEFRAISKLIK